MTAPNQRGNPERVPTPSRDELRQAEPGSAHAMRATDPCPPDEMFARLIEGTLAGDRLRQLEAHCDACVACGHAMAELARTITPARGDWLGERYRILEPLAAGGMGVVDTAFDTKLQRKVAIKRLREAAGGPTGERRRKRFLREAQMLASLSHPNVLTVHDVGEIEREIYVVMELVDGWPMSRWISEAQPRPGWRQIVDMYLQVGRGLSAAHQLGVVHRDVKPENIFVGRSGRVLIGDFGLAGLTDARAASTDAADEHSGLTQTGAVLGTPAYMAPELHAGKPSDLLSDQFSFCVSMHESLHGRRPFRGQTAADIAAAMRAGPPPPGADGVPRSIDRVLATGLAAEPTRRHLSMDALLTALERARDPRTVRPLVVAGVAVVVAIAAAAAAMLRSSAPPSSSPAPSAEAARQPAPPKIATALPVPAPHPGLPPAPALAPPAVAAQPHAPPKSATNRRTAQAVKAHVWITTHPEIDPPTLLMLADRAHADRDGAACLTAMSQVPADAWPPVLADRALRRRAACEMLSANCETGRRTLARLDGAEGARAAVLANCPAGALPKIEDRIRAVAVQADEARYAGNKPARRKELEQVLQRQAAAPEIQACFRNRRAARACGPRLALLARSYQVLAESFLVSGDCATGARLDVLHSQARFQHLQPDEGDPALRCRAERIAEFYRTCAAAGGAAERRCLAPR